MVHTGITGRQAGRIPQKKTKRENLFEAHCLSTEASLLLPNEILMLSTEASSVVRRKLLMWPFQPITLVSIHDSTLTPPSITLLGRGASFERDSYPYYKLSLRVCTLSYGSPHPFIQPSFPPIFHKFTITLHLSVLN